jgi:adenylate kinase
MILILGTPGAGKTTQTQMLAEYLKCPWFSMGQLIRDHVAGEARQQMLSGKILSDQVALGILEDALKSVDLKKDCVVEGNPRSVNQARWWIKEEKANHFKIKGIIHLVADNIHEALGI